MAKKDNEVKDSKKKNSPKTKKVKNEVKKIPETIEIENVEVVEENVEEKVEIVDVEPTIQDSKQEKQKMFWDEIKSFFILAIIIGLVILGGWLFIKYAEPIDWNKNKKDKEEVKISDTKDYNVLTYSTKLDEGSLEVINDKYLIEYDGKAVSKIMDLQLNVLYETELKEEYMFVEGKDGKLYAISTGDADDSLILNLYVLENEKIVEVKEFSKMGVYYVPLYSDDYLVGIVGNNCYLDDELNSVCETELFTLDEKNEILNNLSVASDLTFGSGKDAPLYTRNANYVVVRNIVDGKYGLYDLVNHKLTINTSYDDLFATYNNSYVAVKDGKVGIIDKKLKKLVDFEYDFIDINEEHYVVSKDNKLAIMDKDYKLVTGYDFSYVNTTDNDLYNGYNYRSAMYTLNTFYSTKIDDNYLLVNNIKNQLGYTYLTNSVYLIEGKDNYLELDVEAFGREDLIYSFSKKTGKLIIYDDLLKEINTIDLSNYDYDDYPTIELINGNTIVVTMDSELYFDYETGDEIENIQDVTYNIAELELKYTHKDDKVSVVNKDKTIVTYPYDPMYQNKPFKMLNEEDFYYLDDETYVIVMKR